MEKTITGAQIHLIQEEGVNKEHNLVKISFNTQLKDSYSFSHPHLALID